MQNIRLVKFHHNLFCILLHCIVDNRYKYLHSTHYIQTSIYLLRKLDNFHIFPKKWESFHTPLYIARLDSLDKCHMLNLCSRHTRLNICRQHIQNKLDIPPTTHYSYLLYLHLYKRQHRSYREIDHLDM